MLLTVLEIVVLLSAVMMPLVPREAKSKKLAKTIKKTARPELSQFVVNQNGNIQELSNSHDTSLFQ